MPRLLAPALPPRLPWPDASPPQPPPLPPTPAPPSSPAPNPLPPAQVLFSTELDARAGPSVRSVAVHPGEVLTNVIHTLPGPVRWLYARLLAGVLLTPRQGARSTVHAATSPRVLAEEAAAPYLHSDCAPVPPSPAARDAELARWAWAWSVDAAGLASDRDLAPVAGGAP